MKLTNYTFFCLILAALTSCSAPQAYKIRSATSPNDGAYMMYLSDTRNEVSSKLEIFFSEPFCSSMVTIDMFEVYEESEWEPRAEIIFENEIEDVSLSILLYFDSNASKVMPLISHSEDNSAEAIGTEFSLGTPLTTSLSYDGDIFRLIVEPFLKFTNITDLSKGESVTHSVDVHELDIGFVPTKLILSSVASKAKFYDLVLGGGC